MSFNILGLYAEPKSAIGGNDKSGFEGNRTGEISAALSVLLSSTFYTSRTESSDVISY